MRQRLRERFSGVAEDYEHELVSKDGTITWIRVRATPYRGVSGEIQGTVGALSCIDRQKSLERENEYLRDELKDQEKEIVRAALKKTRGKIYGMNGAAALLGLKPTTLTSKFLRLGLKRKDFLHG